MKGCLKQSSRAPSPAAEHAVKHVAFGSAGSEEIYVADEWDRTPTAPARHLTPQDIVELNEIQRSLPRAEQPADLIRPSSHYLSAVPVGLLPLLPSPDPNPVKSPALPSSPDPNPVKSPPPSRKNPRFAFLPLLPRSPSPSPPSSPPDTPALTTDNSPRSTASSSSPEPSFLQLPPSCAHGRFCTPGKPPGRSLFPTTPPPIPRNLIVINGIEIVLDDDLAEAPSIPHALERPATPTQTSSTPLLVPSA